jgi:poly(3-hydroxybutyrate) depolymerase
MKRKVARSGMVQVSNDVPNYVAPAAGLQALQLDAERDSLLYTPPTYATEKPTTLAAMLHGAGGDAHHRISLWQQYDLLYREFEGEHILP